jgi:O-antigen/teichoic acid export membrane protein
MSIKKLAFSGVYWSSIQSFGSQLIGFGLMVVLSRMLMPSEFGLIAMIGFLIGVGSSLVNCGLTQSLIRTDDIEEEDYSSVFCFNIVVSIGVYVIVFFTAPVIANFFKQILLTKIIRVYTLIVIINAFSTIQTARLTKLMDFRTQMIASIPSVLISSIIAIVMAYNGFGVWSLVWSALIQAALNTINIWYLASWIPNFRFNKQRFSFHFKYGFKLLFSSLLETVFSNLHSVIIGKNFATSEVAFYNRANSLQMLPAGALNSIFMTVSFPLFSSIKNDDLKLKNVYQKIIKIVIFIVTPILVTLAILAEPLFRLLFTEFWLPAVPYFQILCINGILYPIHSYNLQILNVKGRSDLFLKLEVFKKIITLIGIFIALPYGIYGLLYGSVITSILSFFINSIYSGKFINYSGWDQILDLLPIFLLCSIFTISFYFFDQFVATQIISDFGRIISSGVTGLLLFFLLANYFQFTAFMELKAIYKTYDTSK